MLTKYYILHKCPFLKETQDGTLALECRSCHRSFRNRRQILKHICLGEVEEDNDEENGKEQINLEIDILVYGKVPFTEYCDVTFSFAGKNSDDVGVKDYGNLGPVGADPNQTGQKSARRGLMSKKGMWVV